MKIDRAKSKLKFVMSAFVIAFAAGAIVFAVGLYLTLPHWWLVVSTAQVVYNGKLSPSSRLYRSGNGELILKVSEPEEFAYWILPRDKEVLSPSASNFLFYPFAAIVRHPDQYGVNLETSAKTDLNPEIIAGSHFIEFTGLRRKRIKVTW